METKLKYVGITTLLFLYSCVPVDYQTLKVDYSNQKFEIISSKDYVIDSIGVEKFGNTYYSLSLKNKDKGLSFLNLENITSDYQVFIDSIDVIPCEAKNYNMDIFIRVKGSKVKLTRRIAKNFKHVDDIQLFRGLTFKPCLKRVDTIPAERRYR
ncbi:hypothetical protein [Tenacibaculum halocynthiae]|uniref:hypothetical protein n=1 Tax=Tenacibaculum halocynthiae TaxID=1254437 RepID=UPI003D650101